MTCFRRATPDEGSGLLRLERAASLAALAHVFPPERCPYPDADVLARWRLVLADPGVIVEVVDGEAGLRCLVAHDGGSVRHLAVDPTWWGHGLGSAAMARAESAIAAAGTPTATLWVLGDNHRARRLYESRGWRPTEVAREAAWPPYPVEWEYALTLAARLP